MYAERVLVALAADRDAIANTHGIAAYWSALPIT